MDDLQLQQERAQREEEWAAKEVELEEKEAKYISQLARRKLTRIGSRSWWGNWIWRG
jgi:hypothetical protein